MIRFVAFKNNEWFDQFASHSIIMIIMIKIIIRGWRANCDVQFVIYNYACLEYLAKYASKKWKNKIVGKSAVRSISISKSHTSDQRVSLNKIMIQCVIHGNSGHIAVNVIKAFQK